VGTTTAGNQSKKTGMRFNTYNDLLSTHKQENEGLEGLIAHISEKVHAIKDLLPANFTLDDLNNELHSMALIHVLPQEYSSFISSLMLIDKLDSLTIHEAFRNEELNCEQQLRTSSDPRPSMALMANTNHSAQDLTCELCGYKGHSLP